MAYHYKESGLDNVWIANGYTIHETPYGQGVSIHNTEGLHKAIGLEIVEFPKPIDGAELRFLRLEMELTQRAIGGILNVDEQAIRRWEKARKKPINGAADRLLRALYKEYVAENSSLRHMVNRLAELNQKEAVNIRLKDTAQGWKPEDENCAA